MGVGREIKRVMCVLGLMLILDVFIFHYVWVWEITSELCSFWELCRFWSRNQGSYAGYDGYVDIVEVFGVMWVLEQES